MDNLLDPVDIVVHTRDLQIEGQVELLGVGQVGSDGISDILQRFGDPQEETDELLRGTLGQLVHVLGSILGRSDRGAGGGEQAVDIGAQSGGRDELEYVLFLEHLE
jgi:hypothetical protein